jgi:GalNAc-alpha-(1->4)-GalNAc-alpha-(1->3)-diNAcBac-PP-undecaprenol alpha-1,4-N-acetyl-D-galactosaminyltransferase
VKLLFVSRLFQEVSGGVERMAIALMNELCARGHTVELLSWDNFGANTYYPLDPLVVWHRLNMGDARDKAGWLLRLRRQVAIRRLLDRSRPDVAIAFQHGPFITVALAALRLGIPVVAAERNAPQRFDHLRAGKWRALIFQSFRLAERITVQLDDYVDGYPAYLRGRIVSIPNPVQPTPHTANPAGQPGQTKRLLSVGRLTYQKNQAVLIEAFARLADAMPQWHLVIVGAGEDEWKLKRLANEKGLLHRIEFTGAVTDVEHLYLSSHLFCLSSRWEGFPNALAEAMAHGLPSVGFSDCAGVRQLIIDGHSGCLAPGNGSSESLAEAMRPLMADDAKRQAMGRAAVTSIARFAPRAVFDRWEALFQEVSRRS